MYLRSVTIRGFKSFATKATLRFEPGITVIVGPNGSGKSNVTDSVLWALGEQSAKNLRGSTMEDVIFAGSNNKQALGVAEVSLTLDNSDGRIPIEFSEVTIARRLFRSGESEYSLNRSACRLIDIHEILSDTGLGREMYSVISQGRLDDILNSKPIDRRQLLEEAAGVLKHKRRRDRALKKLLSMHSNLVRGKDILREVNRQLGPLKRQADQAQHYIRLEKELKEAQTGWAVARLGELKKAWEDHENERNTKERLAEQFREELKEVQTQIDAMERELEAKGILAGDIGEYRRRLEGVHERINSGLLLLEEKGKNLIAKLSELRQTIHQFESRITGGRAEEESLQAVKGSLDEELAVLYQDLAAARKQAEAIKKAGKLAAEEAAAIESRVIVERATVGRAGEAISRENSLTEANSEKISFLREQSAAIVEQLKVLGDERRAVEVEKETQVLDLPKATNRLTRLSRQAEDLAEAKGRTDDEVERLVTRDREARAALAALEAVGDRAKGGFRWWAERSNELPRVAGQIMDLMVVPKDCEKAFESVLGHDVHAFVTGEASDAVEALRRARGRADKPMRLIISAPGVTATTSSHWLKPANRVVDCPVAARAAVDNLLANIWITDDLAIFMDSGDQVPVGGVVVDMNGDYIDSRGLVAKQPSGRDALGGLTAKRELTEAHRKKTDIAEALRARQSEQQRLAEELKTCRQEIIAATAEAQKLEGEVMALSQRVLGYDREIDRLTEQASEIDSGIREREKALAESGMVLDGLEIELKDAVVTLRASENQLADRRSALAERQEEERSSASRLSAAQISMASLTERQTHAKTRLINIANDIDQAVKLLEQHRRTAAATEELRYRIQPVHDLYTELRTIAEAWAKQLSQAAQSEQTEAAAKREDLRRLHQRARDLSTDLELAGKALTASEVARAQVETEVGQVTKYLVDEVQVPLETALAKGGSAPADTWRAKEADIRAALSRIGPVNQIAAAEFEHLEERQVFLTKQIDDLIRSQKALRKVVEAIDKKINDRFRVTFDEVNANFDRVFQELFPGGSARLAMVESQHEDGESGVEIEAQPHGKRLQSLTLLSGGERSLVGLALLFALYYTRPSPFYILDEVEAALDDANLRRFIKLLHKLKDQTQFIIITHQRRTMEVADCVYGVSMQADGISKVISQKLTPEEVDDGQRSAAELVATAVGQPGQVQEQL